MAGEVKWGLLGTADACGFIQSGKLKALGQLRATRSELWPDVPTATHLLERPGQAVPRASLALGSAAGAARVIGMTTGITSTQWKGTAQGSCRVVFGSCPATDLPDLAGKTGTADFLTGEDSPYVKDGLQIPAKLFGGVFTAQGKRWAITVMALRNRDARGTSLDLQSSAAAEAGLTLVREMRRP